MNVTDRESDIQTLVNGCLKNDRLSQRQLYDRYVSQMFVLCRRYANSDEEAEDMLMEGFMQVFKSLKTFKGDSSFNTWIHSVMVNTAISHYRSIRKFRNEQLPNELDDESLLGVDETITTAMDARIVIDALQRMPETYRTVFNLHALEGYTFAKVGEVLGKTEDSMRVVFLRARKWLRRELGDENG